MRQTISNFGKKRVIASKSSNGNVDNSVWIWVILAVLLIMIIMGTCWCNGNGDNFGNVMSSGFKNTLSKVGIKSGNPKLKELDILYFMSPSCPWCQKMSDVLSNEGSLSDVTVVDVTKPEGQKLATEMGAASKGIPAFISKKKKTGTVGFKKSVDELIKSLEIRAPSVSDKPVTDEMIQDINNLNIVVFVSPSCGWCNKMKQQLSDTGCMDVVELVDVSTPEGKQLGESMLNGIKGVPACYSKTTGKSTSGYKPISKLVEELQ